jgi:hypothetical protein
MSTRIISFLFFSHMMFMCLKSNLIPEFCAGDLHWKVVSVYINRMNQVCTALFFS